FCRLLDLFGGKEWEKFAKRVNHESYNLVVVIPKAPIFYCSVERFIEHKSSVVDSMGEYYMIKVVHSFERLCKDLGCNTMQENKIYGRASVTRWNLSKEFISFVFWWSYDNQRQ
ncbi:hypothetical protein RYX36_009428, partial [Vicia faba]